MVIHLQEIQVLEEQVEVVMVDQEDLLVHLQELLILVVAAVDLEAVMLLVQLVVLV